MAVDEVPGLYPLSRAPTFRDGWRKRSSTVAKPLQQIGIIRRKGTEAASGAPLRNTASFVSCRFHVGRATAHGPPSLYGHHTAPAVPDTGSGAEWTGAVAKAREVKLGNPNGAASLRRAGKGGVAVRAAVSANAAAFAADLAPVFEDIRATGHLSFKAIEAERTARGIGRDAEDGGARGT